MNSNFEFAPSIPWKQKELLSEEFKSLGFYISDHPLNEHKDIFDQLKIMSYDEFYKSDKNDCLVAGTVMSIQEKKSAKGTPYAIIKFSDNKGEFELFLFAEILVNNREKLKESESFILTLQKDTNSPSSFKRRVNIKKIISLVDVLRRPFNKVVIELKDNYELEEIKNILSSKGETAIDLVINTSNKKAFFSLQNNRKFDLNHLKALKAKKYVSKITF